MSRFLSCITDLEETTVADLCYTFIQDRGTLPSDEEAFELIKGSKDIEDAGRKINRLFLTALKEALLSEVSYTHREAFSDLLIIETSVGISSYSISFNNYKVDNPEQEDLEKLYEHILYFDEVFDKNWVQLPLMFSLQVEAHIIQTIKDSVEEGIFDRTVDGSCGTTLNIIIDLGFIADRASSNTNFEEDWALIWDTLIEYNSDFTELKKQEPQFIELIACIED